MASNVSNILSGAKDVLKSANDFSAKMPPVSHEYSNASYKMAAPKTAPKSEAMKEVSDVASGIKWRQDQAKALNQ